MKEKIERIQDQMEIMSYAVSTLGQELPETNKLLNGYSEKFHLYEDPKLELEKIVPPVKDMIIDPNVNLPIRSRITYDGKDLDTLEDQDLDKIITVLDNNSHVIGHPPKPFGPDDNHLDQGLYKIAYNHEMDRERIVRAQLELSFSKMRANSYKDFANGHFGEQLESMSDVARDKILQTRREQAEKVDNSIEKYFDENKVTKDVPEKTWKDRYMDLKEKFASFKPQIEKLKSFVSGSQAEIESLRKANERLVKESMEMKDDLSKSIKGTTFQGGLSAAEREQVASKWQLDLGTDFKKDDSLGGGMKM